MTIQETDRIFTYKYVSFDLFDTLIFRTVNVPEDIFDLVEEYYNCINEKKIKGFRKVRHNVEVYVRDLNVGREITLNEIYSELPYPNEVKNQLRDIEVDIEIANCIPNYDTIKLLKECYEHGQYILVSTDMYLDSSIINKILEKIGIYPYIYKLLLSSEIGYTKKSGVFFERILSQLTISNEEIIHIGDNAYSDVTQAEKNGISAIWYQYPVRNENEYIKKLKDRKIVRKRYKDFYYKTSSDRENKVPAEKIGYDVLGPVVYEFVRWIHDVKARDGIDILCFVAREGYHLYRAYMDLYPEESGELQYIALNKNLMRMPALYINPTIETFLDSVPMKPYYSSKELANYLSSTEEELEAVGIVAQRTYSKEELLSDEFKIVFRRIVDLLQEKLKGQYEYFLEYCKDCKLIDRKIGLVNNSINGNGQSMLERIFAYSNANYDVVGLQFVKSRRCKVSLGKRCKAWITDSKMPISYSMEFLKYALVLEHFLFEPIGTALNFYKRNNKVFVAYDLNKAEIPNYTIIEKMQNASLDFIRDYSGHIPLSSGPQIIMAFYQFMRYPSKCDLVDIIDLIDNDAGEEKSLVEAAGWGQAIIVDSLGKKGRLNYYNLKQWIHNNMKGTLSQIKYIVVNKIGKKDGKN